MNINEYSVSLCVCSALSTKSTHKCTLCWYLHWEERIYCNGCNHGTTDNSFYRTVLAEPLAKQYDVPLFYRMDGWTYLSIFKISTPLLMS